MAVRVLRDEQLRVILACFGVWHSAAEHLAHVQVAHGLFFWWRAGYIPLTQLQPIEDEVDLKASEKAAEASNYVEAVNVADRLVVPAGASYVAWLAEHQYEIKYCELLSRSWAVYKSHVGIVTGGALFTLVGLAVLGPIGFVVAAGYFMLLLNGVRSGNATNYMRFNDMFSGFTLFFPLLGYMIVKSVLILGQLFASILIVAASCQYLHVPRPLLVLEALILAVPFCYTCLATCLAGPILLEFHTEKIGVFAALGLGFAQLKKQWLRVFVMCWIMFMINSIGMGLCGLGAVFTVPFTAVVSVNMWREMFGNMARDFRAGECVVCV